MNKNGKNRREILNIKNIQLQTIVSLDMNLPDSFCRINIFMFRVFEKEKVDSLFSDSARPHRLLTCAENYYTKRERTYTVLALRYTALIKSIGLWPGLELVTCQA